MKHAPTGRDATGLKWQRTAQGRRGGREKVKLEVILGRSVDLRQPKLESSRSPVMLTHPDITKQ